MTTTGSEQTTTQRIPALVAVASIVTVAFAGSVVVTPLYTLFQREFGFSEITLTLIYAVYAVGNVVALLVFGQVSDQIGRKGVALPALLLAALSAVLFMVASGTAFLFVARLLIGLAVGVASGSGTAWLADELGARRRGTATVSAATANLTGIALGPPIGGLLAEYAPLPLKLPFIVYIAVVVVVAVSIARVSETQPRRVERLRDVRVHPRVGVPRETLGAFAAPAVTGFVVFAVGGLYFAIIPGLVIRDLHVSNVAVGGFIVFEYGAVAAALIVFGRRVRPVAAMALGLALMLPALGLIVTAQALESMPLLLVATALAGVGLALGYRGSLQVVNEIAPPEHRAEVVSTYYISCFLGNSLPVIGIGVVSSLTEPLTGSIVFAAVLAALALSALLRRRPAHR